MFILMFLLTSAGLATPTYLCGLDQTKIEDVIDHYEIDTTFSVIGPQLETPFDCDDLGDVCDLVGSSRAEDWLCDTWADMENEETEATIKANAASRLETEMDAWFVDQFPNGVLDNDAFWTPPPVIPSCTDPKRNSNPSGTSSSLTRVNGYAYVTKAIVWKGIGVATKAYERGTTGDRWKKDPDGEVWVQGVFDGTSSHCPVTKDKSDDDGHVNKNRIQIFWIGAIENVVEGTHTYDGKTTYTCKIASWNGC